MQDEESKVPSWIDDIKDHLNQIDESIIDLKAEILYIEKANIIGRLAVVESASNQIRSMKYILTIFVFLLLLILGVLRTSTGIDIIRVLFKF